MDQLHETLRPAPGVSIPEAHRILVPTVGLSINADNERVASKWDNVTDGSIVPGLGNRFHRPIGADAKHSVGPFPVDVAPGAILSGLQLNARGHKRLVLQRRLAF